MATKGTQPQIRRSESAARYQVAIDRPAGRSVRVEQRSIIRSHIVNRSGGEIIARGSIPLIRPAGFFRLADSRKIIRVIRYNRRQQLARFKRLIRKRMSESGFLSGSNSRAAFSQARFSGIVFRKTAVRLAVFTQTKFVFCHIYPDVALRDAKVVRDWPSSHFELMQ